MPVGVVVAGGAAEAADRAEDVRRVRPQELELVVGLLHRGDGRRDGAARSGFERRQVPSGIGEIVGLALAIDGSPKIVEDGYGLLHHRLQLPEEGSQVLGGGLRGVDQGVEVVEGAAQVEEGGIGLAQGRRQRHQGAVERLVLGGDRPQRLVGVGDQAGEVIAALGDRADHAGAVDEEVGEHALVAAELLEEAVGGDQRRAQVLVGLVRVLGPGEDSLLVVAASVDHRGALDDVLERLALGLPQGVEELIEVDGGGRVDLGDDAAVGEFGRIVGPGGDRDVAVGDPRERGGADHGGGPLVQGAIDRHLHLRLGAVGELDVVDRAHRFAADQHLVPLHQLATGLEDQLVVIATVAAEQQVADRDHDDEQGAEGGDPA